MRTELAGMGWLPVLLGIVLLLGGCSRQQGDWDKARGANSIEAYQQFVKNYPSGDFTAQARARIRELEEERDWQKARDSDTPDAYQAFLKQYPEGKWTEEARIRIENFSLAQPPAGAAPEGSPTPGGTPASSGAPAAARSQQAQPAAPAAAAKEKAVPAKKAHSGSRAPARPASKSAGKSSGSHRYAVQLGAFSTGKPAGEHAWRRLTAAHPALLKGLKHRIVSVSSVKGGTRHTLYKLQATGLSHEHARSICHALAAHKQSCLVVAP